VRTNDPAEMRDAIVRALYPPGSKAEALAFETPWWLTK
jgi:hypothetical protein